MQSLGRFLRKVVERDSRGPDGRRADLLYSNMRARSPMAVRLGRLANRLPAWRLPRRAGVCASAGFLALWLVYGAILGGHVQAAGAGLVAGVGHVAVAAGFGIETVRITGQRETRESDILRALDLTDSSSLITFDPYAARARLDDIAWVKSSTVQKLFPTTLKIEIEEREPFALWQIGGIVSIIDRDGSTIGMLNDRRHASLPMVVGYGANRAAGDLVEMISAHPRIAGRVRAAVRVAERRWNLHLDNGVEVRLPEEEPAAALGELVRLDEEREILSRDIVAIDLRVSDRVAVRMSDGAALRRKSEAAAYRPNGRREGDT